MKVGGLMLMVRPSNDEQFFNRDIYYKSCGYVVVTQRQYDLISDESDHATMHPTYYFAAIDNHDNNNSLTEATVWWM
jgi:hypothetical protein